MGPSAVWNLALNRGPIPAKTDMYNKLDTKGTTSRYGNTRYNYLDAKISGLTGNDRSDAFDTEKFEENTISLSWDYIKNGKIDIRLFYAYKGTEDASVRDADAWTTCRWSPHPDVKDHPDFYKYSHNTENWPICYSIEALKYAQSGYLVAILLYVPFLNVALGTRQIAFPHFAVPSFSFYIAIFFYDELRKMWLRQGMVREAGRLKLKGWIVQNTYY